MSWRIHVAPNDAIWVETERGELIAQVYRGRKQAARDLASQIVTEHNAVERIQAVPGLAMHTPRFWEIIDEIRTAEQEDAHD